MGFPISARHAAGVPGFEQMRAPRSDHLGPSPAPCKNLSHHDVGPLVTAIEWGNAVVLGMTERADGALRVVVRFDADDRVEDAVPPEPRGLLGEMLHPSAGDRALVHEGDGGWYVEDFRPAEDWASVGYRHSLL
jgi:hypothetical protein